MYKIDFYGVVCKAKITEYDFELIGDNKITQGLLDFYSGIVLAIKNFNNWFLSLLGIDSNVEFKIKIINKIK